MIRLECPRCSNLQECYKWGTYKSRGEDKQRYRCRKCKHTFIDRDYQPYLYRTRKFDENKILEISELLFHGESFRSIAKKVGIKRPNTICQWMDRFYEEFEKIGEFLTEEHGLSKTTIVYDKLCQKLRKPKKWVPPEDVDAYEDGNTTEDLHF